MKNKEDKNNLVPRLRFPEFNNFPKWEEKVLKDISSSIFDGTHQTPRYTEKGIPFYSVENIVSGNKNKFISREDYLIATSKNKPEKGDIILTRIGNIGFSAIINWDFDFSIYVTLAVIKKSINFNSYYLHSYFQSDRYQKEIRSKSLLNAVPCKINMEELRNTSVILPTLPEQQKIADCLSSLDELITAEDKKLTLLKSYKKGLMQKLFPAEGETVPELRFPEFINSGDWEEKELGELGNTFSGLINKSKEDFGTGRPYISYMNIFLNPIINIKNFEYVRIDDNENQSKVQYGDIFFTTSSETPTEVGMSSVLLDNVDEVYLNSFCFGFRLHNFNTLLPLFATYYFRSKCFRIILNKLSQGVTRFNLSKNKMMKCYINLPKSIKEQQKIADCLSSLDDLINAQDNKIKKLKEHKKGLMQGLFPSAADKGEDK